MKTTSLKAAIAVFAAAFSMVGAAFADQTQASKNSAVLENINAEIITSQERTLDIIVASAEERIAMNDENDVEKPSEGFTLASN